MVDVSTTVFQSMYFPSELLSTGEQPPFLVDGTIKNLVDPD